MAAALAEKADRHHLHTADDVMGLDAAVGDVVGSRYDIDVTEEFTLNRQSLPQFAAVCAGMTIPAGIWAVEVTARSLMSIPTNFNWHWPSSEGMPWGGTSSFKRLEVVDTTYRFIKTIGSDTTVGTTGSAGDIKIIGFDVGSGVDGDVSVRATTRMRRII